MPTAGRPKAALTLTEHERTELDNWARRPTSAQALAQRAKIVLACAEGKTNTQVAEELNLTKPTVGKWRKRFIDMRLDGLTDQPRPGRPHTVSIEQVQQVIIDTLETKPAEATHWSRRKMAEKSGLSATTIGRIWRTFDIKPHRVDTWKLSNDPQFVNKVYDIIGLYLNPPEAAVVYCVDEKSQIQALQRSSPTLPMMPGMPEKRTHDYLRHGTTTLFAGMNITTGEVIAESHRKHRAEEFRKFLNTIDKNTPAELDVHIVCDNYGTHKTAMILRWLDKHPRFHMHFTPTYSSWINQVERLFAEVTRDMLQRSDHRSVQSLEAGLRKWVRAWNENPKPYVWTKTAEEILESIGRLLQRINGAGH